MNIAPAPPDEALAVLDFWFGPLDGHGLPSDETMRRWFDSDDVFDTEIRARFGAVLERARELYGWRATPRGALALIILTDQFARNVHRGTARAYAHDDLALAVAIDTIDAGRDRALLPIERVFLYMPLEHAEDPEVQERSVACFHSLAGEVPVPLRQRFREFASFADSHHAVVARFGRFPHRNAILGRPGTREEIQYLRDHASPWGQGGRRADAERGEDARP